MTTLDTKAGTANQTPKTQSTPAVQKLTEVAASITEQEAMFASAAALAPSTAEPAFLAAAPHMRCSPRPEKKPRRPKHYPELRKIWSTPRCRGRWTGCRSERP